MRPNGTAIRAIRESQGMGLRELARQTGRSRPYLSRVERGTRGASHRTVELIAEALKVPPDAITREEKP